MITAIAAIVSAVAGVVGGIIKSSAANLASLRMINQANVDYARTKELTYYTAYQTLIKFIAFTLLIGLLLIGLVIYLNK